MRESWISVNGRVGGRTLAVGMSLAMAACAVCPVSVSAAEPNTPKEEVIYVNLRGDGTVEDVNAVNIFDMERGGTIVDYGDYSEVRNMTTTDQLDYADGRITVKAGPGRLYYEGKMESREIPWDISIRYELDGREYDAAELAGKSGALRIAMDISRNASYEGGFYDDYALQASVTLDTDRCENIQADGATAANVGSEKQLTYTVLPGKGLETEITADVTDFEMGEISINGIPLTLDVEVDDQELKDRVTELQDAIGELDDGAGELSDGTSELNDSASDELQSGVASLKNGAASLDDGVRSLSGGIEQVRAGLQTLNAKSDDLTDGSAQFRAGLAKLQAALDGVTLTEQNLTALTDASSEIKGGIASLTDGVAALQASAGYDAYKSVMAANGLNIDDLLRNNAAAADSVGTMIASVEAQASAMEAAGMDASALRAQAEQLRGIASLLAADNGAIGGVESYLSALNQNIGTLLEGAKTLQAGYETFDGKITELVDGLGGMAGQVAELADGVNTLVEEYEKLDDGIHEYTDGVARIVAGYSQVSSGAQRLVSGSAELRSGTEELSGGTGELVTGIEKLSDGASELKDGTNTMREETADMDGEIDDQIDELLESVTGGEIEECSFVSDKNTNVKSVQFVIRTDPIEKPEPAEPEPEQESTPGFWQRLLDLFRK